MVKMSKHKLASIKRNEVIEMLAELLADCGEEVLRENGNAIVFPSTDSEGNELFVKIVVSVPRGDRSGEAYDGYDAAAAYKEHCEEVAAKAEQRAKDNAMRAEIQRKKREAAKAKKEAEAAKRKPATEAEEMEEEA